MSLTLYYHPLASYCHKVLIALYEKGIDFEKRLINLGAEADRAELKALWPFCKFPVIHDGARQRSVAETTIIIQYLDRFFPGDRTLIPGDWERALDVHLWDRIFDNYVQGPMQEIVANQRRPDKIDLASHYATLETAYRMIDERVATRTWIDGEDFGLAECAAAPGLFYASTLLPFPAECGHLNAYFDRLMQRPSVSRVIDEAKPFFMYYPFVDAIPARFR